MVKKSLIIGLTAIILSLCCSVCFAADNNNSINLGNEITQSIDKTGQSMQNMTDKVFSSNVVNDMRTTTDNMGRTMENGMNTMEDGIVNMTRDRETDREGNSRNDNNDNNNNGNTDRNAGDYNAARTTAEATTRAGFNTMSTTTWMWIILAVAAIIIIAAIWYYATQNND